MLVLRHARLVAGFAILYALLGVLTVALGGSSPATALACIFALLCTEAWLALFGFLATRARRSDDTEPRLDASSESPADLYEWPRTHGTIALSQEGVVWTPTAANAPRIFIPGRDVRDCKVGGSPLFGRRIEINVAGRARPYRFVVGRRPYGSLSSAWCDAIRELQQRASNDQRPDEPARRQSDEI